MRQYLRNLLAALLGQVESKIIIENHGAELEVRTEPNGDRRVVILGGGGPTDPGKPK